MRRFIVGSAVLALTAGWAAPAAAAPPTRVSEPIQFSFEDTELSTECGFTVLVSGEGNVTATLNERRAGAALEVDRQVVTWTYEAPSTGKSLDYLSNLTAIFEYPEGALVGAPAQVTVTGTFAHDVGVSAAAGRLVFDSTIIAISDAGIPIAPLGEPVTSVGRFPDFDVAALCAAIS